MLTDFFISEIPTFSRADLWSKSVEFYFYNYSSTYIYIEIFFTNSEFFNSREKDIYYYKYIVVKNKNYSILRKNIARAWPLNKVI